MLPLPKNDIPIMGEPQPSSNALIQPWTMTKTLAIDSWSTQIQSHKSHIYAIQLTRPNYFSFFPFSTDRPISTTHILTGYEYQHYPQICIQAKSTLHKDKHMSSIFTSLDKHMSSVYGVHPLSPPNTYPV